MAKSKRKRQQIQEVEKMEIVDGEVVITPKVLEEPKPVSIQEAFRKAKRNKLVIKSSHGG
jgi:hypothetical protein